MNKVFLIRNVTGFGGGEVYQLNLAKMLKENGFSPVILTNSKELILRAKKDGYEVMVPPYINNQNWSGIRNLLLPVYLVKLCGLRKWYERIFKEQKPDTINVQSRDDYIAATIAAKKYGIKVLWTDHADFKNWVLWNVNVKFKNLIGKMIIDLSRETEKVIFVSKEVFGETKKMIAPRKIEHTEVIYNGVFDELEKYKNNKPAGESFVFIGRVTEEKGVKELLRAFAIVREKYSEATLKIYGAGEIDMFQKIAGEGVEFCGETKEPLRALSESAIFVLPSYKEGLSLSLLDAAMMKKTIIATDVDGNLEVVENGVSGILVPTKNAKKLATAMEAILMDGKKARELAEGARKKFEQDFDFEKIFAEKMLPLYNIEKEKK